MLLSDERPATSTTATTMNAAILSLQAQLERERQERQEAEIKRLQYEREHMLRMIMMGRASFDGEESVRFTADSHQCCGSTVHGRLADRATRLAVIVCHPWGPLGGSMHDPTVVSIVSLMTEAGLTTLRFSFRSGIGRGHSSAADLRAACAMLRSLDTPPEALLLVGYSYGSLVVADVAPTLPDVAAFAMVAPPFGFERALFLGRSVSASAQQSAKPKLACIGSDDQFCSPELFDAFSKRCAECH
jgi:alpha/beta superfamily hydrolase